MPHLLFTRPEDPDQTARLTAAGWQVTVWPMMETAAVDPDQALAKLAGFKQGDALVLTSQRVLEVLAGRLSTDLCRPWAVFCVGASTAAAARAAGFGAVFEAEASSASLLGLIAAEAPARNIRHLLHLCSPDRAVDLTAGADKLGLWLTRHVVYRADLVTQFSSAVASALAVGKIDAVAFFSSRTAERFGELLAAEKFNWPKKIYCLSDRIAASLPAGLDVDLSSQPTMDSLEALLISHSDKG